MKEILESIESGKLYCWADYNCASYSPTGIDGMFCYFIFRPQGASLYYSFVLAMNPSSTKKVYFYSYDSNKWFKLLSNNDITLSDTTLNINLN